MTTEKMKELLSAKDEKITVEYKSCTNEISESVYETVCSFSNRYGGWIIWGVKDGGSPVGVNRNAVKNMKRNFVTQLNNTNKMSPTLYLSIEEFEYEGKLLLWTYVPPSSTVIKCAGRIYDRNDEGDLDITDSPIQTENMYARKTGAFSENKLFPYATEDDLRMDLMPKVRRLVENKNSEHEWLKMTDHEIMVSAGLYEKNLVTGEKGYNLAAIMLFGKDEAIRSCASGYVTDAKFTPIYSGGGNPELYEADVFRIVIPLTSKAVDDITIKTTLTVREQLIYDMICESPRISVDELAVKLDVARRTILRDVQEIKKKVFLIYDKKEALWKLK